MVYSNPFVQNEVPLYTKIVHHRLALPSLLLPHVWQWRSIPSRADFHPVPRVLLTTTAPVSTIPLKLCLPIVGIEICQMLHL